MTARRVLVVEDNPITRRSVRLVLERNAFEVIEAPDGASAVRRFDELHPDIVLQDLRLPDIDGFELLGRLRARPRGADTPILACSGLLTTQDVPRMSSAGFDDVITKPIEPHALLQIVGAHLAREQSPAAYGRGRRILVVDDDPLQLKLVALKLARLGFEVERAGDGVDALERARQRVPDVIVSDIMMPRLDGFGLCLALRNAGDPVLAAVPVILATSTYVERSDRELARRAGASDYVVRTPDLQDLLGAVRAALDLRGTPSAAPGAPEDARPSSPAYSAEVEREHASRIVKQLERQVATNAAMAQRCATLGAALSVLSGIADALVHRQDTGLAIVDVLNACFDAGGISVGILQLRDRAGSVRMHRYGLPEQLPGDVEEALHRLDAEIPGAGAPLRDVSSGGDAPIAVTRWLERSGVRSSVLLPLVYGEEPIGSLLLASASDTFEQAEGVAFGRGIASQITQAVVLARAFEAMESAQRAAREHARVLQSVLDGIAEGIVVLDARGAVTLATRAAQEILGAEPRGGPETWPEAFGLHRPDMVGLVPPAELPPVRALAGEAGDPVEMAVRRGTGADRWVKMTARPLLGDAGEPSGAVALLSDVTEERAMQAKLLVADRMVTMGTLAAGVAHEINNPLAAVLTSVDYASSVLASGREHPESWDVETILEALDDVRSGSHRVRDIVRDLRIFSRSEEDRLGLVDLHRTLDSSARMAWNEIRHRARLVKSYGEVPLLLANEARLGQVFLNLIVNAAQAIPIGAVEANEISLSTRATDDGMVRIEVRDTGVGMPPEVLERLFTPFFTTKPAGEGTGLGLSICQRLVTAVGGTITVSSRAGEGTTIHVVLPAANEPAIPPERVRPRASVRRCRVLIVDDDVMVLSSLRRGLARRHDVLTADSAQDALEVIRREPLDAVLCDLMMPSMSGIEFHRVVAEVAPEMVGRLVFATGGAFTVEAREFLDALPNPTLEKPFTPEELDRVLELVLARRKPRKE